MLMNAKTRPDLFLLLSLLLVIFDLCHDTLPIAAPSPMKETSIDTSL
jgi:hypothetical protein